MVSIATLLKLEDSFGASWGWPDFAASGSLKMKVKSLSHVQLFHDPIDCSLPGSSVHGIFQIRVLEWVAISLSRGFS